MADEDQRETAQIVIEEVSNQQPSAASSEEITVHVPAVFPSPDENAAIATQPYSFVNPVLSYGWTELGQNQVDMLAPPPYPGTGPETNHFHPDIQWRVPIISEETARNVFVEYARKRCCLRTTAAMNMVISSLEPLCVYRYHLESFIESRELKEKNVPYSGGAVDSSANGTPPQLWEMQVDIPQMFAKGKVKLTVPHTESVKSCYNCFGTGKTTCSSCFGTRRVTCFSCGGGGRTYNSNFCYSCSGSGRIQAAPEGVIDKYPDHVDQIERTLLDHKGSCTACTFGKQTCVVCVGRGKLLNYLQMKVIWTNIVSDFVTDQNSQLLPKRYKKVTGNKIFDDERNLLVPIMEFPDPYVNQVSASYVQQHQEQFADNPRIRMQRHSVEIVPVTKVHCEWKEKSFLYFVYGVENKVYTKKYPATYCCSVM